MNILNRVAIQCVVAKRCFAAVVVFGAMVTIDGSRLAANSPLEVSLRSRVAAGEGFRVTWQSERWLPSETAVIVCDMWDAHHCYNAVQRVKDVAPRMNAFLEKIRDAGGFIIHAPSDCTGPYENHPARQRALAAPQDPQRPEGLESWCDRIPAEEAGIYPIDQSDGGEDDDLLTHSGWHRHLQASGRTPQSPWQRQIDTLRIDDRDAMTDSGIECWNLLRQRGIRHVMLVGVHTNMCVLGRPFGLRQLAKNGMQVVLVRDLTDTMYNPARWPFVNHHTGTDRIVAHIEKYVCPTIDSTQVLGGMPFRFYDDRRPTIALVVSEQEYKSAVTLPQFAERHLGRDFHVRMTLHQAADQRSLPGLSEVLAGADVMVMSIWRQALPPEQLAAIRAHLAAGKHLVAIRTSSHAFATRDGQSPPGLALWPEFDREILGGHYQGHHGNRAEQGGPRTLVRMAPGAKLHPILTGLAPGPSGAPDEIAVPSWLYKMQPLAPSAVPLLLGRVEGREPSEPVAWTNVTPNGGRVFYTSLGHPDEFHDAAFQRLLSNAIYWAAGQPVPELFPLTPAQPEAG